ncbi:MAG: Gfo/Idh/MocA family oxidoreductase [Deltaproteobacteria bacterium]|nr:Gfo/Idh/MocA family oxidoreductase [Deltaproteobacteria bacterium]
MGVGYWGPNILRNLTRLAPERVRWVCDADADRLDDIRREYDIRTTTDLSDLLDDPDTNALMLALPPQLHHSVALRALEAGKHLFVEKPMALSLGQVREVVRVAEERGRLLMVGLTYRYNLAIDQIGAILASGRVGPVREVYSTRTGLNLRSKHANVIWALAPHDVSILAHWFGGVPERVRSKTRCVKHSGIEDVAEIEMDFAGGVSAKIGLSWIDPQKKRHIVVIGARGAVVYDEIAAHDRIDIYSPQALRFDWDGESTVAAPRIVGTPEQTYELGMQYEEPLLGECRHFLECLDTGRPPLTGGRESVEVTKVIQAILTAANNGPHEIRAERAANDEWTR